MTDVLHFPENLSVSFPSTSSNANKDKPQHPKTEKRHSIEPTSTIFLVKQKQRASLLLTKVSFRIAGNQNIQLVIYHSES
jgi:hypothetical protein